MRSAHVLSPGIIFRRWALAVALALLGLSAYAKGSVGRWTDLDWNTTAGSATGTTRAGGSLPPSSWSTSAGGAHAHGTKPLPWPGKAQAQHMAAWKAKATPQAMAKAITNPVAGAITIVGGMALKQLLDLACVRVAGGTLRPGVAWDECVMAPTVLPIYRTNSHNGTLANTRDESCQKAFELGLNRPGGDTFVVMNTSRTGPPPTSPTAQASCVVNKNGEYWTSMPIDYRGTETKELPTGDYTPIAETEANQRIEEKLAEWCNAGDPRCHGTLREVAEGGGQVEVEDPELSGPASTEGGCTTTRTVTDVATGSYTQKTVCNSADYDYIGNTVKKTDKKTETVTQHDVDGNQTGPEETTTEETQDERSTCEKDPSLPQCNGDFDVPAGEIPKETHALTYVAESLGFGSGSCPSDVVRSIKGKSVTVFSYSRGCEWLDDYVKPMVLALSAWIAFLILMPGKVD